MAVLARVRWFCRGGAGLAGEVSRCEKKQMGPLCARLGRPWFTRMSQWLVPRASTDAFLGLGQGFKGGWGCEAAQGRLGPEEPPTSHGSHLYLYPGGTGLGTFFCREAGWPRLIPQVLALPPPPGI